LCVRSGRDPASGHLKENQAELTRPCLRLVMDHRTCPVTIPEELDLSRIDRTLGGSVRSLPPERPVNGERAVSELFPCFLLRYTWDLLLTTHVFYLSRIPQQRLTLIAVAAASTPESLLCHRSSPAKRDRAPPQPRCHCPALNRRCHLCP